MSELYLCCASQILSTIHECMTYLKAHPEEKEAEVYTRKYEQCLSRALTAIKTAVIGDLEACRADVEYRQSRILQQQNSGAAGDTKSGLISKRK